MIDSIEDLGVWAVGYLATVWGSTAEHSGTFQLSLTRPRSPLPKTVHAQHLVALLGQCLGAPFTKQAGLASWAVGTLRLKLTVLQNTLVMIQLRHPGRRELEDVNFALFEKYKEYLLGDYCYGLRSSEDSGALVPPWSLVLSYEHAIRKHAYPKDQNSQKSLLCLRGQNLTTAANFNYAAALCFLTLHFAF